MMRNKRGKLHNRAFIILLTAVLLAMQILPSAVAGPLFSYAQNESEYPSDEILPGTEDEDKEERETEIPQEIEEKTETDKESEADAEASSETEEDIEADKETEAEDKTSEKETEETSPETVPEIETEETSPEAVPENETEETDPETVPEKETPKDPPKKLMLKGTRGVSSYLDRLTDRSNDIGVPYEGYTDSPYTVERVVWAATQLNARDDEKVIGGTYLLKPTDGLGVKHDYTDLDEQYWDGKKPFLIAPTEGNEGHILKFRTYNDFLLEDKTGSAPNGPLKIENLRLEVSQIVSNPRMNLYGRGQKFVIGEGVTTEEATSLGNEIDWRIYGGTEHDNPFAENGRPNVITNIVVASGEWDYAFGGGEGPTGTGTQVTIRGDANIHNVYGGGERKGSIGIGEGNSGSPNNLGVNVYVEDGEIDTLYGGCAINGKKWLTSLTPLPINEDINIDVSGGYVDRLFGGSDTHDDNGDSSGVQAVDHETIKQSAINGDVTINLSATNVARSVIGDINRTLPIASTIKEDSRQVKGSIKLNVLADQELDHAEMFDVINVDGSNLKLNNEMGFTTFDSDYSSVKGYIGQVAVTNGGRLELSKRAVINEAYAHYNESGSWTQNWREKDNSVRGSNNHNWYYLRHGWVGETSEADREDSVIAINGQTTGITPASGTAFNDSTDVCGLLIHGSVGSDTGWSMQGAEGSPGYSTLEVLGTPIYSSGDDYYYYIVADGSASNTTGTISQVPTSVNGGEAFKEPEDADYIVCYRHLADNKIGWYLREKPTASVANKLVHTGDDSEAADMAAHVELNGYAYEWADTAASNNISLKVTRYTGSGSVTNTDALNITKAEMADIGNDSRFSNAVYDSDGYLESFNVLIDNSQADDAAYYKVEVIFDSDAANTVGTGDGARCVYDFVNTGSASDSDYQDSIMTTTPYGDMPKGADAAKLKVNIPYGCTASSLVLSENDGNFNMVEEGSGTVTASTLHSATTVYQNYNSVTTVTANSAFAVQIGGEDLSAGVTQNDLASTNEYLCEVSSYKNVNKYEISPETASGLKLNLTLSGINKDGDSVGTGNPGTVNNGELRIRTVPLESEIVPPVTGVHTDERMLETIWLLLAASLVFIVTYIKLKKRRRWSDAGG